VEGAGPSIARGDIGVLEVWIRAEHPGLLGDDVAKHAAMLRVDSRELTELITSRNQPNLLPETIK